MISATSYTCEVYSMKIWSNPAFRILHYENEYLRNRFKEGCIKQRKSVSDGPCNGKADFIIVEFSVNDDDNEHFLETYEGLISKLYKSKARPAVLTVNSVRYDNGENAQEQHLKVGRAYHIPCVSMKPCLYEKVLDGTFTSRNITEDDLHPNDLGHSLMAEVIIDFLEGVYEHMKDMPDPASEADSLHLDTLAEHLPYGKHTVEIEVAETHENDKVPFYLVSVIVSAQA